MRSSKFYLLLIAFPLIMYNTIVQAQGIVVQRGTFVYSKDNATITCNKCGITGDGNVDFSSATLFLKGGSNVNIGTANSFAVKELNINKSSGNVLLAANINIRNKVTMVSGLLDLSIKNLLLDSVATINGENESTRIIGPNGGEVIISLTLNNPQNVSPGNLGATITSLKNLGLVTIKRGHKEQNGSAAFNKSILRYYNIIPANNSQLTGTLRFSYLDAELNGVNESTATIFKSTNNGSAWTNMSADARDVNLDYIDKKNLASLAEFTISNAAAALSAVTQNNSSIKISHESAELKAWPLPAKGPFNLLLNGASENTQAMIYDNSGRLLQRLSLTPGTPHTISNLSPGIYFIKTADTSVNTLKIIVQ
jgi:hypothetical protein